MNLNLEAAIRQELRSQSRQSTATSIKVSVWVVPVPVDIPVKINEPNPSNGAHTICHETVACRDRVELVKIVSGG